jgi:hypothetical protein
MPYFILIGRPIPFRLFVVPTHFTPSRELVQGLFVNIVGVNVLYTQDVACCLLSAGSMDHEAFAVG